jgi:hypothetical protein
MDTISHGKNVNDNVARPRDGINRPENFLYGPPQSSKADDFKALELRARKAGQEGTQVPDEMMEKFNSNITSKLTTAQELGLAGKVAQELAQRPEVLSERGQVLLMNSIANLPNQRNSDYSMSSEARKAFSNAADRFSQLKGEAQGKFFDTNRSIAPNKSTDWDVGVVSKVVHDAPNGLNDIAETAQDPFINLLGNAAQNIHSASPEKQAEFQRAAIELIQKTQFPIKFDSDSFREANFREIFFTVPENVRTPEYNAQLATSFPAAPRDNVEEEEPPLQLPEIDQTYEPEIAALSPALPIVLEAAQEPEGGESDRQGEKELAAEFVSPLEETGGQDNSSPLPEVVRTYTSPQNEAAITEILPQALPVAPESLRTTGRNERAQDELEENLATTQAE